MITKKQAIEKYIKDNFEIYQKPRCSVCKTSDGVGMDHLASDMYCKPCLIKDLENDEEALRDYMTEDEWE